MLIMAIVLGCVSPTMAPKHGQCNWGEKKANPLQTSIFGRRQSYVWWHGVIQVRG